MKRTNLHEAPGRKLARALDTAASSGVAAHTRPAGVKHLGDDGDIIWRAPELIPDPNNPSGPPINGPTIETWSIRELPALNAALEAALDAAKALISNRVTSTSAPTSADDTNPETGMPYAEGAVWWQWDDDESVIGIWVRHGGEWVAETLNNAILGSLDVAKLYASDAVIADAVILKIAAQMIESQYFRTTVDPITGLYVIIDSFGFRVVDNDGGPEGDPVELIKLGPDGEQLIQLGQGENLVSINSSGGISARTASVHDLWLDGRQLRADDMFGGPRGIVSHARMSGGRSRRLNGRDTVLGLEGTLSPGRVYKLETSSMVVDTEHGTCEPFAQLHYTLDGSAPQFNWGGTARKESKIGPYAGFRTLPGMIHWIDLTDLDPDGPNVPLRAAISLGNFANNGWVQAAAVVDRLWMVCEDWGSVFPHRGTPFFFDGGTGGTPPPVRQTTRWTASGMATYVRGGARDQSSGYVQGQYSSWNRETLFTFPSMTSTLSGATIHRITLRSFFDSWYYSAGGTASWCWHGDTGIPASSPAKTFMIDTTGWPRGAAREINIIPEEFGGWQSGARRGFIFSTPVTALSHYGRLSSDLNQHWIEVEYSK